MISIGHTIQWQYYPNQILLKNSSENKADHGSSNKARLLAFEQAITKQETKAK